MGTSESSDLVDCGVGAEEDESLTGEAATAELRKNGRYESLGAALAAARHAVEKIDPRGPCSRGAEYFAANPGQQLRAWFSPDGVELASGIPQPEGEEPWGLVLRMRGVGRGEDLQLVVADVSGARGSRVEMVDPTTEVIQWFENGRDGLEQGFTLNRRPGGAGAEVSIRMEVAGSLQAERMVGQDGDGVRFVDAEGEEILCYTSLRAWDAEGRDLPVRMELRGTELALLVSDEAALYPVTIDPLFANVEARLLPESVAGDRFGNSVALSGDIALVGVHEDDTMAGYNAGSAYVFVRDGTTWNQQVTLTAAAGVVNGRFGHSVAVSGDTALIGAPGTADLGGTDTGKVYVFIRNGTAWSPQATLTALDGELGDEFGKSVALSGETALVGAHLDGTTNAMHVGSAYVFVRGGTTWSQQAKLTAGDAAAVDRFGNSVALSGDTALVGAHHDNTAAGTEAGSAYVFVRSGTLWSQQAKLTAADAGGGDEFGISVALSGNTALVGAAEDNTADGQDAGSAYVFVRSGTIWSQQAKLTAGAAEADDIDYFGWSVALSGETALVGAWQDETPGGFIGGSAYVFVRSGTTWNQEVRLTAASPAHNDEFGAAVALSGDTALVGAYRDDTSAGPDAGSASVFVRNGTVWSLQAMLTTGDATSNDRMGNSVALSGGTALVGVARDDTMGAADAGSAYVFVRSGSLWRQQARLVAGDAASYDQFGSSVTLAGDTALVGAPFDDTAAGSDAGSAYVFVRSGTLWNQQAKLTAADAAGYDNFGISLAIFGETALVGAYRDDTSAGNNSGSAHVFVRSGTQWNPQAMLVPAAGSGNVQFGISVALWGDTALVGTARDGSDPVSLPVAPGSAYVFVRSGTAWSQQARLAAAGGGNDRGGNSVALSGETALIGAPFDSKGPFDDGYFEEGSVYVFVRGGTMWSPQGKLTAADAGREENFGGAVALSGDIALVGTPRDATPAGEFAGSAYVFARDGVLWHQEMKLTAGVDASPWDWFGTAVALDEDTALVASPDDETNGEYAGSAYVFLLGALPEVTRHPVSRTVPLTDPGTPVTFTAEASGYGPLHYQWRKDGSFISGADGILTGGTTNYTIPAVTEADAGLYDVLLWNVGGSVTSSPATLAVNALSQFAQSFPGASAEALGVILVNVSPSGIGGAWRFVGEQQWRGSGTAALGLATGDRVIEFRPVPGFIHPPAETVSVTSGGAATLVDFSYYAAGTSGSGGMSVTLKPDEIAALSVPEVDRAQWRFLGEDDTQWRDSGTTATGLVPGNYLIECKPVAGRTTPRPASVPVEDGQTPAPILTYFLESAQTGSTPGVLPFETVSTSVGLPYAYVGQIRSNVGASTGFVVKEWVVATAGHVVFDDGTLSAVTGLQWLFQRDRGSYEPEPQTPRGFYLFDGYSAQRIAEGTPGISSPASQELDVAALYFLEKTAGRGGFGGFLASDAVTNEWMVADAQKMLVGYPVEGVPANHAGRMHATPPTNANFTPGGSPHTYTTSDISSSGGSSGGPLCVQFEGGAYYPAAIYLGGSGQTVVRAIDSEVIRLFDAAENTAATGNNHTGGGITLTSVTPVATAANPGILKVTINPETARAAGGGWRLVPEPAYRQSGSQRAGLNPGSYKMELSTVAGFQVPTQQTVQVVGGSLNEVTFTYAAENSELDAWRFSHFGTTENAGDAADDADGDGDGVTNIDEFTAGTDPNDPNDALRVLSAKRVGVGFSLSVSGKAGRVYEMQFRADLTGGSWSTRAIVGPLGYDVEVSLTDPAAPPDHGFYRVGVTKP